MDKIYAYCMFIKYFNCLYYRYAHVIGSMAKDFTLPMTTYHKMIVIHINNTYHKLTVVN